MSKVQVALVRVNSLDNLGYSVPVASSAMVGTAEVVTSSGSASAASGLTATAAVAGEDPRQYIWRVSVLGDESIYIHFASSPVASPTAGFMCIANNTYEFSVAAFGHKFSVINVA